MQIEKGNPNIFRITLSGYELAALISSSRWIVEGAEGEVTLDAVNNLKQILANYDDATRRLNEVAPRKNWLKRN